MPSYCCSSSDFLQSHYTVLLSTFLLPFSRTSWCGCSLPCISQILQVQICFFSVLLFSRTDQEFLQCPKGFLFWRCLPRISLAVSVTAVLKVVIAECISESALFVMQIHHRWMRCRWGAKFLPIMAWNVSITQTWVFCVLTCWFFSDEGGRSSSASHSHFSRLLLENFVFWRCALLIGSASSLERNQSGCGVVLLGNARSIFWMLCYDQKCSPTQGR